MFRCVVCAEAWETLFGFFCREPHALMTDPGAVDALRDSKGFCAFHAWMLTRYASPRNLSQALPSLLADASAGLSALEGQEGPSASRQIREMLGAPRLCPACCLLQEAEPGMVAQVREHLLPEAAETDPPPLCLRHLAEVLSGLDAGRAASLLRAQAARGDALTEALKGYATKYDTRQRSQMSEAERDAYRDALVFLTGERDLAGPLAWGPQAPD